MPALPKPQYSRLVNRSPVYYGWVILGVSTLGLIMTSAGQTYGVSIFLEYFIIDLGLSRSMVSTLYTVGTLLGSLALPVVGRYIDQHGLRRVFIVVTILFGVVCIYMGSIQNAVMLGIGFTGLRMLGQGSLYLVCLNAINRWWVRRRGLAIGVSGLVASLIGVGIFPALLDLLITNYGWRLTYILFGVMLFCIMLPIGSVFLRQQPEDYGIQPDGDLHPDLNADDKPLETEEHWTLKEARQTRVFWLLIISFASISMLSTGLMFHMIGIITDHGLSTSEAALVYVPIALTTAIFNLVSGILVDRTPVRWMLIGMLFLQAVALAMVSFVQDVSMAYAYGIILGASGGLSRTVSGVVWPTYFGRLHLGSITGMTAGIGIAASALGPMPFGIARDLLGSYDATLLVCAAIPLSLCLLSPFIRKPEKVGV
jgi:MFS family permease